MAGLVLVKVGVLSSMSVYESTMSETLTNVKALLLTEQNNSLSRVKTWQRGLLGPSCIFPSLAIMPIDEYPIYGLSNGKYDVDRTLSVEVYDISFNEHRARESVNLLIEAVNTILKSDITLLSSCYALKREVIDYHTIDRIKNKFLGVSSLIMKARSRESFSTPVVVDVILERVAINTFIDAVITTLENNKSLYPSVSTIDKAPSAPVMRGSSILVSAFNKDVIQTMPNADTGNIILSIAVVSEFYTKEKSLNDNLDIVEAVKDVIQSNRQFGGYCEFSTIQSINYESTELANKFSYISTINVDVKTREF